MAKRSLYSPWGIDANRSWPANPPHCIWRGCRQRPFTDDLPVCLAHALIISERVHDALDDIPAGPPEPPKRQPYVYYLMIGPSTVKIGTTIDLRSRLNGLRTDPQYVVAIERGDATMERQRHKEFAAERVGRRENFQLSERLKQHIEALQPHRDELITIATTYPLRNAG